MKVTVNGEARELPDGTTVAKVVAEVTDAPAGKAVSGVAVALNDEVVRRGAWDATTVRDADRLEVLTAVQGG